MTDIATYNQSGVASELMLKHKMEQAKASLSSAAEGPKSANEKRLRETAEDFEAMFLSQMLQPMFEGIEVSDTMGGGSAEKTFRGMMVTEMGRGMARAGGIGLADTIYKEMLKMQEASL